MKLKDFVKLLQNKLQSDVSNFEVEIELNHCESPDVIKVEVDYKEKIVTITKGNCGI